MVTGRPGPVVLDVPFDIFKEDTGGDTPDPREWTANISCRAGADPEGVDRALAMLLGASRPVILVVQGVKYCGGAALLLELAEKLQIHVAWSARGPGALPAHHPLPPGLGDRHGPTAPKTFV